MSKAKTVSVTVDECSDGTWLAEIIIPTGGGVGAGFFESGNTPQAAVSFLRRRIIALHLSEKLFKSINWDYEISIHNKSKEGGL